MKFRTTVLQAGKTATGLQVPDDLVDSLGSGKRPKVVVTVAGYRYRTTVAPMGGRYLVPLSAEHRSAAGVAAGDEVEVDLELDVAPRVVEVPADLAAELSRDARASGYFDGLAYSHRKEWVRWIEEAKKPETRRTRLDRTMAALRAGSPTR
ncbi:MAG TPA: YdeI/OmpD-associated family protein [Jatrophihabitans sp.]|nr:YdeI/OmpD-associated family protein [Jatrophihabitans sp.]